MGQHRTVFIVVGESKERGKDVWVFSSWDIAQEFSEDLRVLGFETYIVSRGINRSVGFWIDYIKDELPDGSFLPDRREISPDSS